jgi:hypothetical protein
VRGDGAAGGGESDEPPPPAAAPWPDGRIFIAAILSCTRAPSCPDSALWSLRPTSAEAAAAGVDAFGLSINQTITATGPTRTRNTPINKLKNIINWERQSVHDTHIVFRGQLVKDWNRPDYQCRKKKDHGVQAMFVLPKCMISN